MSNQTRNGSFLGTFVGIIILAFAIAIAWTAVRWILATLALAFKITVIIVLVVVLLTFIGWIREKLQGKSSSL